MDAARESPFPCDHGFSCATSAATGFCAGRCSEARGFRGGRGEIQQEYTSQDYDTVRGLEQYLYDVRSPILNKIRPISLRNGNIGKYLEVACKFIGELG